MNVKHICKYRDNLISPGEQESVSWAGSPVRLAFNPGSIMKPDEGTVALISHMQACSPG